VLIIAEGGSTNLCIHKNTIFHQPRKLVSTNLDEFSKKNRKKKKERKEKPKINTILNTRKNYEIEILS